jgi:hypothetical protein
MMIDLFVLFFSGAGVIDEYYLTDNTCDKLSNTYFRSIKFSLSGKRASS